MEAQQSDTQSDSAVPMDSPRPDTLQDAWTTRVGLCFVSSFYSAAIAPLSPRACGRLPFQLSMSAGATTRSSGSKVGTEGARHAR